MARKKRLTFRRPRSPYWHYDFIVHGHRFHGSTRTENDDIAEAIAAKIRADAILQTALGQKPRMDLEAAFSRYWVEDARHLPSANDIWRGLTNLGRVIGNVGLHELSDAVVSGFVSKRRGDRKILRNGERGDKPVSPATVNRETDLLRAVVNRAQRRWGVEVGQVDWPAHRLPESAGRERYLTLDEADRLWAEAAPHLKGPLLFAIMTGIRKGNVEALDWSQIDMRGRVVSFRQKSKKPGGRPHTVPLSEPLWLYLANLGPRESGPVWHYQGRPLKDFNDAFRSALRRARIADFRWHDLRHTAATWMRQEGRALELVKEILGHADIRTTMRYAHINPAEKTEAVAAISTHWSRTPDLPSPEVKAISARKKGAPR